MAKGRKTSQKRTPSPQVVATSIVAVVAVAAVAYFAFAAQGADVITSERVYVPVDGFNDVHGLAVSPEDPDEIYVATHHGLIRGRDSEWARVGDLQDDLMGFSMHPTNGSTFWTSGHPRSGGNMGVRQSTDGGFTWVTLWDERVDFHAMSVSPADPDNLWGFYATTLYRSTDGGREWSIVNHQPPLMRTLAADPADANTLYATTQSGVVKSTDAGKTWSTLATIPALGVALDPTNAQTMYASGQHALWKSTDGGETWASLQIPGPGAYAYLSVSPSDPDTVYAATYETGVYKTTDAGETWTQIKGPIR